MRLTRNQYWCAQAKLATQLRIERQRRKDANTAVVFLDQMYPFPEAEMKAALDQHKGAREIVWVQEEPANMGALFYMMPRLRHIAGERSVLSVKRSASPSPSTGSAGAHEVRAENPARISLHEREKPEQREKPELI